MNPKWTIGAADTLTGGTVSKVIDVEDDATDAITSGAKKIFSPGDW